MNRRNLFGGLLVALALSFGCHGKLSIPTFNQRHSWPTPLQYLADYQKQTLESIGHHADVAIVNSFPYNPMDLTAAREWTIYAPVDITGNLENKTFHLHQYGMLRIHGKTHISGVSVFGDSDCYSPAAFWVQDSAEIFAAKIVDEHTTAFFIHGNSGRTGSSAGAAAA